MTKYIGLNEAAGIPRGRHEKTYHQTRFWTRFNEAAGIPRGRLPIETVNSQFIEASMRPRVFPAEDAVAVRHEEPVHVASMRPRVFPRKTDRSQPVAIQGGSPLDRERFARSRMTSGR